MVLFVYLDDESGREQFGKMFNIQKKAIMNIKYLVQIARITMFANRYCPMSNPTQISRKPQTLATSQNFQC